MIKLIILLSAVAPFALTYMLVHLVPDDRSELMKHNAIQKPRKRP